MRKKPYTTAEVFEAVVTKLKEKGKLPVNLDYINPTWETRQMLSDEFSIKNNLDYGGSEGIYLKLSVQMPTEDGNYETLHIGTAKTLDTSDDAMRQMAVLLADFIMEAYGFVSENRADFQFEGYKVKPIMSDGSSALFSVWYKEKEQALAEKDRAMATGKYGKIIVMDLFNRTETEWR